MQMVKSQIRLPKIATSRIHQCMKVIDVNPNYFRRRLKVYSISVVCSPALPTLSQLIGKLLLTRK